MKHLLIINASLSGAQGNSARILPHLHQALETHSKKFPIQTEVIELESNFNIEKLAASLDRADSFVFLTGTYWDSWSSHLQRFLEVATEWEASNKFLGKPAAVIVSMHSVGGKEVMSRLQGVLNNFGCLIPPMSGVAISLATELARESNSEFKDDFWSTNDLSTVTYNLLSSSYLNHSYVAWEVDRKDPTRLWMK